MFLLLCKLNLSHRVSLKVFVRKLEYQHRCQHANIGHLETVKRDNATLKQYSRQEMYTASVTFTQESEICLFPHVKRFITKLTSDLPFLMFYKHLKKILKIGGMLLFCI